MSSPFKQRIALMNSLCRICGREGKNNISVFSESGKKQEIEKKIHLCLPLIIEEGDSLPKQICLTCLHKLDATWELIQLCKDGQALIEEKLYAFSHNEIREEVKYRARNVVEEKLTSLLPNRPVTIGDSTVITLQLQEVPAPDPPAMVLPDPVGVLPTTSTAPAPVPPDTTNVFPQGLIQVLPSSKPVLYQHNDSVQESPTKRTAMPIPKTEKKPRLNPISRRNRPSTSSVGNITPRVRSKRPHQICTYCRKTFPDDIIDHHVSLHLRQSFFTCIDCNKNFRSEMAMSRHRCGTSSTTTDQDDDLICL